ncbi:hypothetical protein MB02_11230 [Croceicoccus estronivorus]|uniref:phosphotransferase family protein n=1 Tax=Croceicoccus estronivorus TaxID=1172626 RepID=UPI000830025E|nr:phosphotransferase family protein [Croceicoccus estronivorus]OCC23721.1 hypothetical protein MB02_11230 [Croceicoccus estronivorus]
MIGHGSDAAGHLLKAMLQACERMAFPDEGEAGLTSSKLAFRTALRLLLERERHGSACAIEALAGLEAGTAQRHDETADRRSAGVPAANGWDVARSLLGAAERHVSASRSPGGTAVAQLCRMEADAMDRALGAEIGAARGKEQAITAQGFEAYLRTRFADPRLELEAFNPLMGGFGKETHFFRAKGGALEGEFVIRRDPSVELVPGACHRVRHEYAVIRAVQRHGFPAPEALWLESRSAMLPGPDFIVMRRSRGKAIGTLAGATDHFDPRLNDRLGETLGRLHSLPAMVELGDLTESIRTDLWQQSGAEAVRRYVDDMMGLLTRNSHAPSAATLGAWKWLAAHLPEDLGPNCLIHGDVGFHNMLMDDGELACLLDWENAQIGHAGMDLGYVFNAAHGTLDWGRVMHAYARAGGTVPSEQTLTFFRILMLARLATTLNVGPAHLFVGGASQLRLLNAEIELRAPSLRRLGTMIAQYVETWGDNAPRALQPLV